MIVKMEQVLDADEVYQLSLLNETGAGRALLKLMEAERAAERKVNEERPQLNDQKITKDFRYIAGQISNCTSVIDSPLDAKELIDKSKKETSANE